MKEQQINMRHLDDNIEESFIRLENNVKMLSDALSEKRFPKEETAEETALALKDMKRLRESVAALARQTSQPAPDSLSDIRSLTPVSKFSGKDFSEKFENSVRY